MMTTTSRGLTDRSTLVVALRTTVLLAGISAEVWNLVTVAGEGERISEHLGYFTVQSNLLVLAVVAWMLLRPEGRPRWFDALRGATTAYIVLTGLVWAVLLASPEEALGFTVEYPSFVQHRLIPVLMALDWLLVPTQRPLRVGRCIPAWMAYPIAYLALSWVRGGLLDGWIPYPFLDPAVHGGIGELVVPTGQVLLAFVVGIALVAIVGRARWRPREGLERPVPRIGVGASASD
ncbi:Pr6Pr family membrane protein [Agrococcus jejuensis]|nr:Pr6Pr family membrane protein [Agrococcus jejuensis]